MAAIASIALICATGASAATFKCVDDKGVTHYGDPMPAQCATKAMTEISKQGTVKGTIDRPLTAEEIKAREDDLLRRKDEIRREADEQRRDRALLATYGAEREFDVSRDKAIDVVNSRWKSADLRLKEIDDQLARLNAEMEFYQAGKSKTSKVQEPPAALQQSMARTKKDRETVVQSMVKMEEEKKAVTAQFEADKMRWRDLRTGKANLKADAQVVTPAGTLGETGSVVCNGTTHTCTVGYSFRCRTVDSNGILRTTRLTCN